MACTGVATVWQWAAAAGPSAPRLPTARLHPAARPSVQPRRAISRRGQPARTASETAPTAVRATEWLQKTIELPPFSRGCHVVTRQILEALPELNEFEVGLVNLLVQHTSASLTINENASPDVPLDLADSLDALAPEGGQRKYRHDDEGPDDMPAHVKSSLMGATLTLPIQHGRLALGTWQGLYLNEHRNYGGPRRVVITLQGVRRADGRKYAPSGWR